MTQTDDELEREIRKIESEQAIYRFWPNERRREVVRERRGDDNPSDLTNPASPLSPLNPLSPISPLNPNNII